MTTSMEVYCGQNPKRKITIISWGHKRIQCLHISRSFYKIHQKMATQKIKKKHVYWISNKSNWSGHVGESAFWRLCCRSTEDQNQQLTSEFLGWIVEVTRVWLNHTAIIHKSGGTTVNICQLDPIYENKLRSRPKFTFITVIFHQRTRKFATNTLKHTFFTLPKEKSVTIFRVNLSFCPHSDTPSMFERD